MNVNAVKTGLYSKLTGDSTLTALLSASTAVYDSTAPEGTDPPYVVFQKLDGQARHTMSGHAFTDSTFLVKAITDEPSKLIAGSIAERVDTLLADGSLTLSTGSQMVMRRQQDIEYDERVDGRVLRHVGATYLIGVQ